jgi:diaminopimelate epimerase
MGAGVTLACGTGSSSSAYVAHRIGLTNSTVNM